MASSRLACPRLATLPAARTCPRAECVGLSLSGTKKDKRLIQVVRRHALLVVDAPVTVGNLVMTNDKRLSMLSETKYGA